MKTFALTALLAGFLTLGLAACDQNDGPLEQAGEAADEAVNDVQRAAEDAAD
ncbi:MAG: hypothetical protein RLO01_09170 [Thalassobaculaceae bacterium]|uniref:hypothetical protein n=1 Tax=Roseitalea porphyridii TaxID=1852022 RepID=UPI0032EFB9FF